jgi:hypothetical protein
MAPVAFEVVVSDVTPGPRNPRSARRRWQTSEQIMSGLDLPRIRILALGPYLWITVRLRIHHFPVPAR